MTRAPHLSLALLLTLCAGTAAACALPAGPLPTQTRAVFVLDTSGSMRGEGDGRSDIFGRVVGAIGAYVRAARPDRVELLTFDAGLRSRRAFDAPAGTPAWNAALLALRADGQSTHLYRSLTGALRPLTGAGRYRTTVFVLTDGIDNDPAGSATPGAALAAFAGRGALDRLYYVALGTSIPQAARRALEASPYASGLTVPVGGVPDLAALGQGGGLVQTDDPARVPLPYPDGTALALGAPGGVSLDPPLVRGGYARLNVPGPLAYGAPVLVCVRSPQGAGRVGADGREVLVRLNVGLSRGVTWLNPGADRRPSRGEDVVLRYRASPRLALAGARLTGLPPGVRAEVRLPPGGHEFSVRLTNVSLRPGETVSGALVLPGGAGLTLPALTGAPGGRAPLPPPRGAPTLEGSPGVPPRLLALLAGVAVLGALLAVLARRRPMLAMRRRPAPARPAPRAPTPGDVPGVEGLEYSEARLLSLVSASGDVTGVPTPLDGPFDLGHLARVPHLSGLRAEQTRHGLRVVQIPPDLEVSQGGRLLGAGDVVRPGTLLGVAVSPTVRAPQVPLGSLAGLGLPLSLQSDGAHLRLSGPYGEHVLGLPPGETDLGERLDAPALRGVRLELSPTRGGGVRLLAVPAGLALRPPGEDTALAPGDELSGWLTLDLPDV